MNIAIPRGDNTQLLLYIWKTIDLPSIALNNLLYKISYELFLIPPDKAIVFVENCLKSKVLTKNDNGTLSLSDSLRKKLTLWQKKRRNEILDNINLAKKNVQMISSIEKEGSTRFNVLLKSFADKGTINRAANISSNDFKIKEIDTTKGIMKSTVSGSEEEPYFIEIDINNKLLKHNCHDFETRRSKNKQFCKHLTRLFLLLKEKNEDSAEFFLQDLANNVDKWEFSS
ncbi:MAG: hypothetical protein ACFFAG_09175 [Promethearchaeota archaeon]